MGEDLAGGVEYIVALRPYAVDVVDDARKLASLVRTLFLLHELLEAVLGQLLVLDVVRLVLLWNARGGKGKRGREGGLIR